MRFAARRPPGAWRALKSGLFGAAPGRTPPAGRRWPCFTGHGGQAQSVRTFSRSLGWGPRRHRVRTCRALDGRRVVPSTEVAENLLDHARVVNHGDNPHRVLARKTASVRPAAWEREIVAPRGFPSSPHGLALLPRSSDRLVRLRSGKWSRHGLRRRP